MSREMNSNGYIRKGDVVLWRGCFGMEAEKLAKVTKIERTEKPREKYGVEVDWVFVTDNFVVSLDNGHWAYSSQITRLEVQPEYQQVVKAECKEDILEEEIVFPPFKEGTTLADLFEVA